MASESKENDIQLKTAQYVEDIIQHCFKKLNGWDPLPAIKEASQGHALLGTMYRMLYGQLFLGTKVASIGARLAFVIVLITNIPILAGSLLCDADSTTHELFKAVLYFNFAIPYAITNCCLRLESYIMTNPPE